MDSSTGVYPSQSDVEVGSGSKRSIARASNTADDRTSEI